MDNYWADNGILKANTFINHINIREYGKRLQVCGVNDYHQNGIAERAIKTVLHMLVHNGGKEASQVETPFMKGSIRGMQW